MTHTALLKRFNELDSQRTPGEWIAGCHPANERLNIVKPIMFGKYVGKLPDCEGGAVYFLHKPNAEFIAAAPKILALANAQAADIAELVACLRALQRAGQKQGFNDSYENEMQATSALLERIGHE